MNMKKLFLLNLPYFLFVYPFDKLAQAFRLAPGADLSGKLLSIGDGFTAALSSPWLSFHPTDLLIGIAGAVILRMAVYLKGKNAKKYRHGIEYGSARWGTAADIAPYMDKDFFHNIPMTQTERITMASRPKQPKYARNKNILVIGGSGSGKTRFFCKPSLLQAHSSYVCTDPKGTLLPEIGTFLERKKYRIKCLNLINFRKSMRYNPLAYIRSEKDILKLVNALIMNTKGEGEKSSEDFWVKAERLYYSALIGYIWYEATEEEKNFITLLDLINASEAREDDETYQSPVDLLFSQLEEREPDHFAVKQYRKFKMAAGKTLKSILISCGARLAPFDIKELRDLMEYDELELDTLGDQKTALFVILSDTDSTFNFVAALMYSQLFNLLCDKADDFYGGRLPVHVRLILDEFANIGQIPNFDKLIATIRSREISASIILQSQSQLKTIYKDAADTIVHMTDYSKITALYSRLSVGDEDRDGGESNSIQNQKIFLENYARGQHLTNIRHYIDDDESGRFFDRSAYSRMMDDVENGKIGVCIMKDLTRWGRDYLQVGNAMEIFRRNNVRFIAVNNGIDSEKPDTLEFAPFINIMSEWYAKDISKKVKTGIKTKGMSGKPIVTEAPYGYVKDPDNKDFWIIDEEAAEVVRLIFRLFIGGKNRNQIAVHLTQEQIPTPTFYMKDRGRGTCKNKTLNEDNRCKWNKVTLTNILTRQEYCGDVVNFKTTKHFRDKHNHYVDRSQWHITENVHEPIISRSDFETVQRILENAPVRRPNGDGEIHPLSGLLFCKDCGAKMHIRIDYRNGGKRHVAYCSEYHKGKAKNPKCHSPHIMDADLLMQTIAEVLKKIEDYSISNRAEFEALVKKNLAMQQTDQTKKAAEAYSANHDAP